MFGRRKKTLAPYSELVPAIYCRVSKDEQGGANNVSLPDQDQAGRYLAQNFGIPVYEDYILYEDESGTKMNERPELTQLRAWMRAGVITAVIIRSSDRLSRRLRHGIELIDEMREYGVRLFISHWGREFDLTSDVDVDYLRAEFEFAEKWGKMAKQTMDWGKYGRIGRGSASMGGTPYGYRKVRLDNRSLVFEVDPEEAEIVRFIYEQFTVHRTSTGRIQEMLHGRPSPKESRSRVNPEKMANIKKRGYAQWSLSTVYEILRKPIYAQGFIEYYSRSEFYDPLQVPIPVIIPPDMWEQTQSLLDEGRVRSKRNAKHEFLLRSRIRCSCGAMLRTKVQRRGGTEKKLYICARSDSLKNYIEPCRSPFKSIASHTLDTAVWSWIVEVTQDPSIIRTYLETAQERLAAHNAPLLSRLAQIERSRETQGGKLERLLEMYADVDLKDPKNNDIKAMFTKLRNETERVLHELREEEDAVRAQLLNYSISNDFITSWERYSDTVRDTIAQFTFAERQDAIEALGLTGRIGVDNGEKVLWIYLYDTYTATVSLSSDSLQTSSE